MKNMLQPLGVSVWSMFSINSIQYNKKSQLTNVMRLFFYILFGKCTIIKGVWRLKIFLLFKLVKWLGMYITLEKESYPIEKGIFQNALGSTVVEKVILCKIIFETIEENTLFYSTINSITTCNHVPNIRWWELT